MKSTDPNALIKTMELIQDCFKDKINDIKINSISTECEAINKLGKDCISVLISIKYPVATT